MSANPQATEQPELSYFNTAAALVQTTPDGVVVPPTTVGDHTLVERTYNSGAVYAAPLAVVSDQNTVRQQHHLVGVSRHRRSDTYRAVIQVGGEFDTLSSDLEAGVIAACDTEAEAIKAAVEWLQEHSEIDGEQVSRPGTADRQPMETSVIDDQIDRIREGSTVKIDSLRPVTVTGKQASESPYSDEEWVADMEGGATLKIALGGESVTYDRAYYRIAGEEYTAAEHVTVSNESNLRPNVDRDTYEWLQEREDQTVIRQTGEHAIEVIEVEGLRDGLLNPSTDDEITPKHRGEIRDNYIDGSDEWADNEVGLPTGEYYVRANGVVEQDDTFAGDPLVSAEEWDAFGAFAPTDTATDVSVTLSNPRVTDRDALSHDDPTTEIIGVGEATAKDMFYDTVGELYDAGWPAAYVDDQYTAKAIADLYTVAGDSDTPTVSDAARAVVGQLGGVGYEGMDAESDRLGTIASMIANSMDTDRLSVGWLGHKRIKDELTPEWISGDRDANPTDLYAGRISPTTLQEAIAAEYHDDVNVAADEIKGQPVEAFHRAGAGHDGVVALVVDGDYVPLPERCIQTAATIADVDLSALDSDQHNITVYPGSGGCMVVFTNTQRPFNVVVDTNDAVDAGDLLNDDDL